MCTSKIQIGYYLDNDKDRFCCLACSVGLSDSELADAIPVFYTADTSPVQVNMYCSVCDTFIEDYAELDEDDPFLEETFDNILEMFDPIDEDDVDDEDEEE